MADHVVTITLSKETYDYVRRLAESSAQSIEKLIQQRLMNMQPLPTLPDNEEAELAALHQLSDDALWTLAAEQMPRSRQARRSTLLELTKSGAITESEQAELDALFKRGDRLMVRKAEAAGILTERGHRVVPQDLGTARE